MSRPAFDTLKYAKSLEESGIDRKWAEAMAKAQKESLKELMEETLATKEDLRTVKENLRNELDKVCEEVSKVHEEITKTHVSLIKWTVTLSSGWGVLIVSAMAVFKFLH